MGIVQRLLPDELWHLFQRVVPETPSRPLGGGRRCHGDREVLAAILFVATSGCPWQQLLPRGTGLVSWRDPLGEHAGREKGDLTGPNPVDRGEYGSKIHLIAARTGLPVAAAISRANVHDSQAPIALVKSMPPICSRRRKPSKLHADKGYDYRHLRQWLSQRGIRHRIARKRVETSQQLGRHRWAIERTISWFAGCHRPHRRYERKAEHFRTFTGIACTLICYRRLTNRDDLLEHPGCPTADTEHRLPSRPDRGRLRARPASRTRQSRCPKTCPASRSTDCGW